MIKISTIEELEAERDRQLKAWIKKGKEEDEFYLTLQGANLSGADLWGADLLVADLRIADLREAKLNGANLLGADLRGADLSWASLHGADLREADLDGANLCGAKIKDTIITKSQYDEFAKRYGHEFMDGFVGKELYG